MNDRVDSGNRIKWFQRGIATAFVALVCLSQTANAQDDLIQPTGAVELVQDGFEFTEGPAWEPKSQTLFFSDIPNSTIHRLAADGTIGTFTADSKHTNGILIPADG